MNQSVRIMLTQEQKDAIDEAAKLEGLDMTTWARPILLEAAKRRIAKSQDSKPKPASRA